MALGLVLQLAAASVGDTVWLAVAARVPAGHVLRPQVWDLGDLGSVLAAPEVDYRAGLAVVRYPVAFWFPGDHRVTVPGAIVVSSAGRSDTLPATEHVVTIAALLPDSVPKASLQPEPAEGVVDQATRSWLPVAVLVPIAGLVWAGLAWFGRRRSGAVEPTTSAEPPSDPTEILEQWRAAGEARTVLDGWAKLIAAEAAARPPAERDAGLALVAQLADANFRERSDPGRLAELALAAQRWRSRTS
ncbi:MAG: hypothetical protein FJ206_13495 [Gemmatimonadetes bacterium]|nr:hypothetical protein [Gemmatimonadota bacterium]